MRGDVNMSVQEVKVPSCRNLEEIEGKTHIAENCWIIGAKHNRDPIVQQNW
jgi:hypothetical protein